MYATIKGKSRPRPGEIFAYQLDQDTCPYLDPGTKQCQIYPERPNVCRSFPIEPMAASRKCHVIAGQVADKEKAIVHSEDITAEKAANELHLQFLRPYLGKGGFFIFDLSTSQWRLQKTKPYRIPPKETLEDRVRKRLHARLPS